MNDMTFETALNGRVEEMLDACTRCGKCVEACPSVAPAGIADASPQDIISGVLDIVRTGGGPDASRKWATSCLLSGECIKACDGRRQSALPPGDGARLARQGRERFARRRRQGVERYRELGRDVSVLSQLQLDNEVLQRLGQKSAAVSTPAEAPDFVFYTGCNVLKTAAHRPARSRHHGRARHHLSSHGRPEPLLRRPCSCVRATSEMSRTDGREHHRQAVAFEVRRSDLVGVRAATSSSPKRPCRRWSGRARSRPFEDDAVHALPRRPARPS